MSGDILGKRIRELRLERQSAGWAIADLRAKGEEPSPDVFAELNEIAEALLVALDDQDSYI